MVLTEQELVLAVSKSQTDKRIRSALLTRRKTDNFSEQAACDREIQRYLFRKGTLAYRFNCCVVHQPWRFQQLAALPDHGWDELGPTNDVLFSIYRTLPFFSATNGTIPTGVYVARINNLNKRSNPGSREPINNNVIYGDSDDDDKPGWGVRLLSCLFG